MAESILVSMKKMTGLDSNYDVFDEDIIISINSYLMALNQIGVGANGFHITGKSETWDDFLGSDIFKLEGVKSYLYMRLKLAFDPPTSSFVLDSYEKQMRELEWRLNVKAEGGIDNE